MVRKRILKGKAGTVSYTHLDVYKRQEHTLKEVDVILWLVEPTTFIGAGERHIAEQLNQVKTPVILVINKIDTLKDQKEIATYIQAYKDVCCLLYTSRCV